MTIFALGYSDNTSTQYLLEYLTANGIFIDGVIFPKDRFHLNWRRFKTKLKTRGLWAALKRSGENLLLRKPKVHHMVHNRIQNIFFVEDLNSIETRNILVDNRVDLLILTSTPIIKPILIDIQGLTILNAHTGWLPGYRGLDANLKAIRDGHPPGVSIHKVTEKIDAGEVYLRENFSIHPNGDILRQLDEKELELSGRLLLKAIKLYQAKKLTPILSDESMGKYEGILPKKGKSKIIRDFRKFQTAAKDTR